MLISNYTARSGLIAQQQRLDTIGHNMANVNTVGYKSVRADFKDMIYTAMTRPTQEQREDLNLQRGHGVMLGATTRSFLQGSPELTNGYLDLCLIGEGFFTVQDSAGNTRYTRDGAFALSIEDDGTFLVTGEGYYVLDEDGERIDLQGVQPSKVEVRNDGTVFVVQTTEATETEPAKTERVEVATLGIVSFRNRMGLTAEAENLYAVSENSGEPEEDETTKVQQGMLEMSNVDLATEMTRMIRAQRAFSLSARALTTADQMDGTAIQTRS